MANRITKGRGIFGSLAIGSGATNIRGIKSGSLSVIHGTILPNRMGTASVALADLAVGDNVSLNPGTLTAGLGLCGAQPKAGTLDVYLVNPTAGTISPGTFSASYVLYDLT